MTLPTPPLIFFSGLAADETVFAAQRLRFPTLSVPRWIAPEKNESLSVYCQRFAREIQPATTPILGGASFGGIIALEMARYLVPRAVVLIGSVRRPSELPRRVCWLRPFCEMTGLIPVRFLQTLALPATSRTARRMMPHLAGLARQFCGADPQVFRWSLRQILKWSVEPEVDCPVFQIHGNRDFVLPPGERKPDRMIEGGGHVISLTHAAIVNSFIESCLMDLRIPTCHELS